MFDHNMNLIGNEHGWVWRLRAEAAAGAAVVGLARKGREVRAVGHAVRCRVPPGGREEMCAGWGIGGRVVVRARGEGRLPVPQDLTRGAELALG